MSDPFDYLQNRGLLSTLTLDLRMKNARKVGIPLEEAGERWPKDSYAWVLQDRRRLNKPVPYKHPNGIVRWVPLSPATEAAVRKKLKSGR